MQIKLNNAFSTHPVQENNYYNLFSAEYAVLNPGEIKEINTGILVKDFVDLRVENINELVLKKFFTIISFDYNKEIKVIIRNIMQLPPPSENFNLEMLYGNRYKTKIEPGDLIGRLVLK